MSKGFDRVAGIYDVLARLVFGRSMLESQFFYLDKIPAGAHVLILGGGTGWLAKRLLQINSTCTILYQEASAKMIFLAQKRMSEDDLKRIQFVQASEIPSNETFDIVITNFFLDLFEPSNLENVITRIRSIVKQNGMWIVTDFVDNGKWWQLVLLKLMYLFFKVTSGIEAASLPPWESILKQGGMSTIESKDFYSGFIKSQITKLG